MSACHTKPFVLPGVIVGRDVSGSGETVTESEPTCDYCGSPRVEWRKCKLICVDCRQINKSCADL
jgi:hypothetical protein